MRTAGVALSLIFIFALALAAAAQDAAQDEGRFDVSISGGAAFSKTSKSTNGTVTLEPTTALNILGSVRYRFNHLSSVQLNIGRTSNSQLYVVPPDSYRVKSSTTEFSLAYVLTPFTRGKLQPFLLGGAGGLHFGAGNQYIDGVQSPFGAVSQTSLAFVYGAGTDYVIWRGLGVRLQYRGLIYKAPDFGRTILFTGARGHLAEPMVGIVAKF